MIKIVATLITVFAGAFSASAQADVLKIASSPAVPPYIIPETNNGIEIDIVRAALAVVGHEAEFSTLPFPRVVARMRDGEFDAALTISKSADLPLGNSHYSDNHITFENVAITLKDRDLKIESIADLSDKSIAAFEFAREYLGPEFAAMAAKNPLYREISPSTSQLLPTLFSGRADVIVIEINIFKYHRLVYDLPRDTGQGVTFHPIFPLNPFRVAFTDEGYRDDFNEGLAQIRKSGVFDDIIARYTSITGQ